MSVPRPKPGDYAKMHDSSAEQYGERARRTAHASLKHSFEKVGDRWQKKDRKGSPRAIGRKQ